MRVFFKDEGHADAYDGLKIVWKGGHDPVLICYRGEEEVERIDLMPLDTNAIHDLVRERGYRRSLPAILWAKQERGEDVTYDDWKEYLADRARRKKGYDDLVEQRQKERREQQKVERRQFEEEMRLDALDRDGQAPAIGAHGVWYVGRRLGKLPNTEGVRYRNSPDLADEAPEGHLATWGLYVEGVLVGEDWVKVSTEKGERYLPQVLDDVRVLRPVPKPDEAKKDRSEL